jgi:hypothetical protein
MLTEEDAESATSLKSAGVAIHTNRAKLHQVRASAVEKTTNPGDTYLNYLVSFLL